jgi:hypothetical protein
MVNSAAPSSRRHESAGANQTRHFREYVAACLFEDLRGMRKPQWQLSAGSSRASPYLRSDKCSHHTYHYAYSRYIGPLAERFVSGEQAHMRVLEIGLGCGQSNVGAGVRLWNTLFANNESRRLELHVLEYDARCARLWQARWARDFAFVNLHLFTGDQSNATTLAHVAQVGGGRYAI